MPKLVTIDEIFLVCLSFWISVILCLFFLLLYAVSIWLTSSRSSTSGWGPMWCVSVLSWFCFVCTLVVRHRCPSVVCFASLFAFVFDFSFHHWGCLSVFASCKRQLMLFWYVISLQCLCHVFCFLFLVSLYFLWTHCWLVFSCSFDDVFALCH